MAQVATNGQSEDSVKQALERWLMSKNWRSTVAWGQTKGIDIDARQDQTRWIIEVKGCGSRPQMRVNYFLAVIGETLQRMDDPEAKYSIAFPDMAQYRGLWTRLPALAKKRLGLTMLLVDPAGGVTELT